MPLSTKSSGASDAKASDADQAKAEQAARGSRSTSRPVGKTNLPGGAEYPPLHTEEERRVASRTQLIQWWEDNPNEPYPHPLATVEPDRKVPPPPPEPTNYAHLASALQQIADTWNSVSHTNVNDQPVKVPSDSELNRLLELLSDASKHVTAARRELAKGLDKA